MSQSGPPTVLVVEDEPHLADLYAHWLGDDYPVHTVHDGQGAIEAIDDSIDVVLLDRRMPGLSGDEVLEIVTEDDLEIKVAMVTAVEPDFDIIRMGFDDYLVKPVTAPELVATVERLATRHTYDERLDEYARLLSKRAALEAEKNSHELERNEAFVELQARIEDLGSDVDRMVEEFDDDDVAAVLRDLPAGGG